MLNLVSIFIIVLTISNSNCVKININDATNNNVPAAVPVPVLNTNTKNIIENLTTNNNQNQNDINCNDSEFTSLWCNSGRVLRHLFKYIKESDTKPLIIVPGLEIVPIERQSTSRNYNGNDITSDILGSKLGNVEANQYDGRRSNFINNESNNINGNTNTYLGRISNYLRSHELKIKFSDLMDKNNFKENLLKTLQSFDDHTNHNNGVTSEARRRDKGMGTFMVMGLMMAKLMATLGLGGIGALAMKALGVSMLALLLSGIIGVKTLASSGHDDGGHHVQYITAEHGHHRRRRRHIHNEHSLDDNEQQTPPLPYRGWRQL